MKAGSIQYCCGYCGVQLKRGTIRMEDDSFTRDHLLPRKLGGANESNIVYSCHRCNLYKADLLPGHPTWGDHPIRVAITEIVTDLLRAHGYSPTGKRLGLPLEYTKSHLEAMRRRTWAGGAMEVPLPKDPVQLSKNAKKKARIRERKLIADTEERRAKAIVRRQQAVIQHNFPAWADGQRAREINEP